MLYRRLLKLQQAKDEATARRAAADATMQHVEPVPAPPPPPTLAAPKKSSVSSTAGSRKSLRLGKAAGTRASVVRNGGAEPSPTAAVGETAGIDTQELIPCREAGKISSMLPTAQLAVAAANKGLPESCESIRQAEPMEESIEAEGSAEMGRTLTQKLGVARKVSFAYVGVACFA
jgi:hypothetical protein